MAGVLGKDRRTESKAGWGGAENTAGPGPGLAAAPAHPEGGQPLAQCCLRHFSGSKEPAVPGGRSSGFCSCSDAGCVQKQH